MRLCNRRCSIAAIHDVAPAAAVNVQVNEAWHDDRQCTVANYPFGNRHTRDRVNAACRELDASVQKSFGR